MTGHKNKPDKMKENENAPNRREIGCFEIPGILITTPSGQVISGDKMMLFDEPQPSGLANSKASIRLCQHCIDNTDKLDATPIKKIYKGIEGISDAVYSILEKVNEGKKKRRREIIQEKLNAISSRVNFALDMEDVMRENDVPYEGNESAKTYKAFEKLSKKQTELMEDLEASVLDMIADTHVILKNNEKREHPISEKQFHSTNTSLANAHALLEQIKLYFKKKRRQKIRTHYKSVMNLRGAISQAQLKEEKKEEEENEEENKEETLDRLLVEDDLKTKDAVESIFNKLQKVFQDSLTSTAIIGNLRKNLNLSLQQVDIFANMFAGKFDKIDEKEEVLKTIEDEKSEEVAITKSRKQTKKQINELKSTVAKLTLKCEDLRVKDEQMANDYDDMMRNLKEREETLQSTTNIFKRSRSNIRRSPRPSQHRDLSTTINRKSRSAYNLSRQLLKTAASNRSKSLVSPNQLNHQLKQSQLSFERKLSPTPNELVGNRKISTRSATLLKQSEVMNDTLDWDSCDNKLSFHRKDSLLSQGESERVLTSGHVLNNNDIYYESVVNSVENVKVSIYDNINKNIMNDAYNKYARKNKNNIEENKCDERLKYENQIHELEKQLKEIKKENKATEDLLQYEVNEQTQLSSTYQYFKQENKQIKADRHLIDIDDDDLCNKEIRKRYKLYFTKKLQKARQETINEQKEFQQDCTTMKQNNAEIISQANHEKRKTLNALYHFQNIIKSFLYHTDEREMKPCEEIAFSYIHCKKAEVINEPPVDMLITLEQMVYKTLLKHEVATKDCTKQNKRLQTQLYTYGDRLDQVAFERYKHEIMISDALEYNDVVKEYGNELLEKNKSLKQGFNQCNEMSKKLKSLQEKAKILTTQNHKNVKDLDAIINQSKRRCQQLHHDIIATKQNTDFKPSTVQQRIKTLKSKYQNKEISKETYYLTFQVFKFMQTLSKQYFIAIVRQMSLKSKAKDVDETLCKIQEDGKSFNKDTVMDYQLNIQTRYTKLKNKINDKQNEMKKMKSKANNLIEMLLGQDRLFGITLESTKQAKTSASFSISGAISLTDIEHDINKQQKHNVQNTRVVNKSNKFIKHKKPKKQEKQSNDEMVTKHVRFPPIVTLFP